MTDYAFFRDGCEAMARNAKLLLELAAEPVTADNLLCIVCTFPRHPDRILTPEWRRSYCSKLLEKAYNRGVQTDREQLTIDVMDYFLRHLPVRSDESLGMLEGAFLGVLGRVTWPEEPSPKKQPVPERHRGPLERWAARRGW